jgi:hypothetical protein
MPSAPSSIATWPVPPLAPAPSQPGGVRVRLALDDDVVEATRVGDRVTGGRTFTVLELERRLAAEQPGELLIPAPQLRFAYATRFAEDFVNGRQPVDRHEAVVEGSKLVLRIVPLPAAGRPAEFTGAVGRFTLQAEAAPRAVDVGKPLELTLRIEGEGNLELCAPPSLDGLPGWHVYGKIDDRQARRRTIVYEMAAVDAAVRAVPALRWSYFDPGPPAAYHSVATEPIAIEVRPGSEPVPVAPRSGRLPGVDDVFDLEPVSGGPEAARRVSLAMLVAALVAPWLAAFGLARFLGARARAASDRQGIRARGAAAAFAARAAAPDADLVAELAEFLAARLRCMRAAVITPDLAARLVAAGVPAELAVRAAARLEALSAGRYGGNVAAGDAASVRALVTELEQAFAAAEARR